MQGFLNLRVSRVKRALLSRSLAIVPSMIVICFSNPEVVNEKLNIV